MLRYWVWKVKSFISSLWNARGRQDLKKTEKKSSPYGQTVVLDEAEQKKYSPKNEEQHTEAVSQNKTGGYYTLCPSCKHTMEVNMDYCPKCGHMD